MRPAPLTAGRSVVLLTVKAAMTGYRGPVKIAAAALGLLLGIGLIATPAAHASEAANDREPYARVVAPLPPNNPRGNLVRVQIEGAGDDWGVRHFAEQMDARWDGLRVRSHGTCAERPDYWCVRVSAGNWDPDQQIALVGVNFLGVAFSDGYDRIVYLNEHYADVNHYAVAAHEFGHILGLNHHEQDGICGIIPDQTALSWAEDKALRPYYGRGINMTGRN